MGGENSQPKSRLRLASLSSSSLICHQAGVLELDACSAFANRWPCWVGESVEVEWLRIVDLLANAFG